MEYRNKQEEQYNTYAGLRLLGNYCDYMDFEVHYRKELEQRGWGI